MLPFLQPKKAVGTIIARRGKSDLPEAALEVSTEESDPALEAACEDILKAIDTRSVKDLVKAIQTAFDICGSAPAEPMGDE